MEAQTISCQVCKNSFPFQAALNKHFQRFHVKTECSKCDQKLVSKYLLEKHMKSCQIDRKNALTKELRVVCQDIGNQLEKSRNTVKKSQELICEKCERKVDKLWKLEIHRENCFENADLKRCPKCKKSFRSETNVFRHAKIAHLKILDFECQYCHRQFPYKKSLHIHVLRCRNPGLRAVKKSQPSNRLKARKPKKSRKFLCEFCPLKFFQLFNLQRHQLAAHSQDKCDQFQEESLVIKQESSNSGDFWEIKEEPNSVQDYITPAGLCIENESTELPPDSMKIICYVCKLCDTFFLTINLLKIHRRDVHCVF